MKLWEKYTKEELEKIVKESKSFTEIGETIGYKGGAAPRCGHEIVNKYQFNTSHFAGQAWNKGKFDYSRFQKGRVIKRGDMIHALTALRGWQCECCKNVEWNGRPIPLEVHHINGDNTDNRLENLQILCPNCHALTENWRGKNIDKKGSKEKTDDEFAQALQESPNIRQALLKLGLSAKGANYERAREIIQEYNIIHLMPKENFGQKE